MSLQLIPARRAVAVRVERGARVEVVNTHGQQVVDTWAFVGGVHDTLLAACDRERYELLGATEPHANCTDNLHAALATIGVAAPATPSPLNLFENARPAADGTLAIAPPVSTPGSSVTFAVELDAVLVFSACPQDLAPTNGLGPTDAHFRVGQTLAQ